MLAGWVSGRLRTMSLAGCVAHTGGAVVQHQRTVRGQHSVHRPGRGLTDHQNTTGIHDRLPKVAQTPLSYRERGDDPFRCSEEVKIAIL